MKKTHGHVVGGKKTPEYKAWEDMKQRCYNKSNKAYKNYGDRGIGVCDKWKNSFSNFNRDMGPRPSKGWWLERVNNDEGYSPENCKWATAKEQANNRRDNINVEFCGRTRTVTEWAESLGLSPQKVLMRIYKGWEPLEALELKETDKIIENRPIEFNGEKLSLLEWCKKLGLKGSTLRNRLKRGWSLKKALTPNVQKRKTSYELNGISKPLNKWCEEYKVGYNKVKSRISMGWSIEEALEITKRDSSEWIKKSKISIILEHNGQTRTLSEWARIQGLKESTVYARTNKLGWSRKEALELVPRISCKEKAVSL